MAKKELPAKLFDKRTSSRYLASGELSEADFNAYLKALPDLADKADDISNLVYIEGSKVDG